MPVKQGEDTAENSHRFMLRWKMMLTLSAILIALGIFVDWSPPEDTSLPDPSSFLTILGILLGFGGVLTATRR